MDAWNCSDVSTIMVCRSNKGASGLRAKHTKVKEQEPSCITVGELDQKLEAYKVELQGRIALLEAQERLPNKWRC